MIATNTFINDRKYEGDLARAINIVNGGNQSSNEDTFAKTSLHKRMVLSAGMVLCAPRAPWIEKENLSTEDSSVQNGAHELDKVYANSLEMVIFELTSSCNLKCVHCLANAGSSFNGELSTKEVFKFIDDLKEAKVKIIAFSGGDPLLREDFMEIVRYAHDSGLNIVIATNGLLLDEKIIVKLKEMRINNIQISLDGIRKETHENIRGVKDSYDKVLKAISLCKKHGLFVTARMIIMRQNIYEIEAMMKFAKATGILCIASLLNVEGRANKDLFPTMEEYRKQMHNIYDIDNANLFCVFDGPCGNPCGVGSKMICVKPNGDIAPCTILRDEIIGNVKNDKIQSVLQESNALRMIRESTPDKIEECSKCEAKERCYGGCKARAYRLNDNMRSPDIVQCVLFKKGYKIPYIKNKDQFPLSV